MKDSFTSGRENAQPVKHEWVVGPRDVRRDSIRLFCFPFAGGGSSSFFHWSRSDLLGKVQLFSIVLPGRERTFGQPTISDWETLLQALVPRLVPYLDSPFFFCGHSLGSIVAWTTALTLEKLGLPIPRRIFLFGARCPHLSSNVPRIADLPDSLFVRAVARYGGLPAEVLSSPELVELVLPALRADFRLAESVKEIPFGGTSSNLTVGGGLDDVVTSDELGEWESLSSGEFDLKMFNGGHFFPFPANPKVLVAVAEAIARDLGTLGLGYGDLV